MASMSLPAAPLGLSPFDSRLDAVSSSPVSHKRKHSRSPNAAALPAFSFHPGAEDQHTSQTESDACQASATMPIHDLPRRTSYASELPDFKFNPGADLSSDSDASPSHPVLEEMAMNQRKVGRSARPAPLPAFTFSPGGSSAQPSPSPTKSSFGETGLPSRGGSGHRRHGSEFVGGGKDGSQLVSTSPHKLERPPGPPVTGAGPRGHAHRRSQAVSISDIDTSDLIKANALAKARAGSIPTTPSEGSHGFAFSRSSPMARQSVSYTARSPPTSPRRRGSAPGVRPRVGFADHVDVIPRPLSLISSETDGSTSTIRGGHSLSGSINSIASPTPRLAATVKSLVMDESPQQRPRTAEPADIFASCSRDANNALSVISLPKRPLSAIGSPGVFSTGSPPTKKKHFWFTHSNEASPTPTPRTERDDPMSNMSDLTSRQETQAAKPEAPKPKILKPENLLRPTASLKKRKYHTWTAGIFSKKIGKRDSKMKARRTPTPPALMRRPSDRLNEIFDCDDTIVIRSESPVQEQVNTSETYPVVTTYLSAPPSAFEDTITSPVIDLDAALGPFGSEERLDSESSARRSVPRLAKLHSSERRGSTDAFGTFHRRTESAPSMSAPLRSTFSLHGFGSTTSLVEDVFDEEEEDIFLADEKKANDNSSHVSLTTSEADTTASHPIINPSHHPETGSTVTKPASIEGLGLSMVDEPDDDDDEEEVVILENEENISPCDVRSSNSTIEAPIFSASELPKLPATSPMPFAYPAPQSHYASSTEGRTTSASMVSSPDADHISWEPPPRLGRYLGEPSPEFAMRVSNDDLPSLTDSISINALPRVSSSANTRSSVDQRSASVVVPSTSRSNLATKRSSLASLSRLLPGSTNGSKLKFETNAEAQSDERTRKKGNRFSKLMYFWRSKDNNER